MPLRSRFLLALLLLAACGRVGPVEAPTPEHLGAPGSNALTDAMHVWLRGASYIEDAFEEESEEEIDAMSDVEFDEYLESIRYFSPREAPPFECMDPYTANFMDDPYLRSAVQFSCSSFANLPEERFVHALESRDPLVRLQSLVVLMRVHAPRSIIKQWETLLELEQRLHDPVANTLLASLRSAFSARNLRPSLTGKSPALRRESYELQWALRAIGVAQVTELLPFLRKFVLADDLHSGLAAQRSLTELHGPEVDALLLECVLTWHCNAAQGAADELLNRNPALL